MLGLTNLFLCAFAIVTPALAKPLVAHEILYERFAISNVRRQITVANLTNAQVDPDPSLDGLEVDPDPNADISTWFPEEAPSVQDNTTVADPETFATSKVRRQTHGRFNPPTLLSNGVYWTANGILYNFTYSACASIGSRHVGYWKFDNGSDLNATWYDIMQDAKAVHKKYGSLGAALDAGIVRNANAFQDTMAPIVGEFLYDDTNTTNSTDQGGITEVADNISTTNVTEAYDEYGHQELRKLLASNAGDVSLVPNVRTVAVVGITAAIAFGLTVGLSISGNPATGQNVTWNNFQGAVGAAAILVVVPTVAWCASPGLRTMVNRLTVSATVSNLRELTARNLNQLQGRGFQESIGTSAGGMFESQGVGSVASSGTAEALNAVPPLGNPAARPLSSLEKAAMFASNIGVGDVEMATSYAAGLAGVSEEAGPSC